MEVIQRCVLQATWTPSMLSMNSKLPESGKQLGGKLVISPVFCN